MLAQLQPVAAATAAAAAGDAELALSALLRARRGAAGSPSDQLDSLLAEAAAGGEGLATSLVAKAAGILFDEAGPEACTPARFGAYLAGLALPALRGRDRDPAVQWQISRTLAALSRPEGGAAALERLRQCCAVAAAGLRAGAADDAATGHQPQGDDIGPRAACTLACSLCDVAPGAAATAELCGLLLPRALMLLGVPSQSTGVASFVTSELLPRLVRVTPVERLPAARVELCGRFLALAASSESAERSAGLALGCRFATAEWQVLEILRQDMRFWTALRQCLVDIDDWCRKRALFLLRQAALGDASGEGRGSASNTSKASGKGKGKKGRRGKHSGKGQAKPAQGWALFCWAYEAIETSTEGNSSRWVDATEQLGQTAQLPSGPGQAQEGALVLDVEPWAQVLLDLGMRHRHPEVQQSALRTALRGSAYNQRHCALVRGDAFVLACCDLLSSPATAASMLRDVRAAESACSCPVAAEAGACLSRHLQSSPPFLRLWVEWFAQVARAGCAPAAALLWLQWLGSLSPHDLGEDGLGAAELCALATCIDALSTPAYLSSVCIRSVLAASFRLVSRSTSPEALLPILSRVPPSDIVAELQRSHGCGFVDWLRGRQPAGATGSDDPLTWLESSVRMFLSGDPELNAPGLATAAILVAEEKCDAAGVLEVPLEVLEQAHTHPYQLEGKMERALTLVAALLTAAPSGSTMQLMLRKWVSVDSVAEAVTSALRPLLLAWAQQTGAQGTIEEVNAGDGLPDSSAGSAKQARRERLLRLQQASAVGALTLLGCLVDEGSGDAATTTEEILHLVMPESGSDPDHLCVALAHLNLRSLPGFANVDAMLAAPQASDNASARWRCLRHVSAAQTACDDPVEVTFAIRLLEVATVALERDTNDNTCMLVDILSVIGEAVTWVFPSSDQSPINARTRDATVVVDRALKRGWQSWRQLLPHIPHSIDFGQQPELLSTVQVLLHVGAWRSSCDMMRELVREMWAFSSSCSDLACVMAWHCCKFWASFPAVAEQFCDEVIEMACYSSDRVTVNDSSDLPGEVTESENELLVRGTVLSYLELVALEAQGEGTLSAAMLRALMGRTRRQACLRTPSRAYELNSATHKTKTAVFQAMCVLVRAVAPGTALASDAHDSAIALAEFEHWPSERQYLDLFLGRLLSQCPGLVAKWLPTALANYELRPQIALGILTVAGFVLLRLVNDESSTIQSLQHCRPLFRSLRAWVNSGHRQLRSLAQVLVVRLMEDCATSSAPATEALGDLQSDPQLVSLKCYLSEAAEGKDFREQRTSVLPSFLLLISRCNAADRAKVG